MYYSTKGQIITFKQFLNAYTIFPSRRCIEKSNGSTRTDRYIYIRVSFSQRFNYLRRNGISTTTFDFSKDDDARDRAYSPAIGSAFASHPFLIRRITKRARVTGAREQVANASSFIARAKRIVSKRAGRARRLDALRLVGPP